MLMAVLHPGFSVVRAKSWEEWGYTILDKPEILQITLKQVSKLEDIHYKESRQ